MSCRLSSSKLAFSLLWLALCSATACASNSGSNAPSDTEATGGAAPGATQATSGGSSSGTSGTTTAAAGDGNGTSATPGAPTRYLGRVNTADSNGVRFCWPGTQVIGGFTGTSLTANMAEITTHNYGSDNTVSENAFDIYIDEQPYKTLQMVHGTSSYKVASGLSNTTHVIRMSKRTESNQGTVQFYKFVPESGGSLVATPGEKTRRIEFVGDSGTAGYGADANVTLANMCTFSPQTERADASYAIQSGIMLNADVHNTSHSGKGLYQNRDVAGDPTNTLPVMWTFTLGDTDIQNIPWTPSTWIPQAFVAVVSGNDFSASTPTQTAFVAAVAKFFGAVRTAYPDAQLFLMVSPMLRSGGSDGTANTGPRATGIAYAQASVAQLNKTDSKVYYLDTPEDFGPLYGCDQHLATATHRKYAALIANAIAAKTGWSVDTAATQY